MPKVDNVGYGKFTAQKMEVLKRIYAMHLAVTQAVLNKRQAYRQAYTYIDATSGKGYIPESTIPGSPLVFLEAVHSDRFQKPYKVFFIEKEKVNFAELQTNVLNFYHANHWDEKMFPKLRLGDYATILPSMLGKTDDRELGLVFIDHSGELPNFDAVRQASNLRPRMEILLYLSARNIKRLHHITKKSLLDYMQDIGKEHWLIRKPELFDKHEWTFLLGSNSEIFQNYKKIDFFRLQSDEAQKFFPKINLTTKERMNQMQPRLFD